MLSLSNYLMIKRKVVVFYDKKRSFSIYYNITPILSGNGITSKITKASNFNFVDFRCYPIKGMHLVRNQMYPFLFYASFLDIFIVT